MTHPVVKGMAAAGVTSALLLSAAGAHAAAKPISQDPRKTHRAVVLFNQSRIIADGLTARAAIQRASGIVKYNVTTAHYIPKGFQLVSVYASPLIPSTQEPTDTQTFDDLRPSSAGKKVGGKTSKAVQRPYFEIDHQFGSSYVYDGAYLKITHAKLSGHAATIAEQSYHKVGSAIDLVYIYWYDTKKKVATEVTADLHSSKISKGTLMKIAASVS